MSALAMPFLTEADPDRVGEGSLDPLGLAAIADHLADQIASNVTARMSRIRFLTVIAAGASIAEELGDEVSSDARTPGYLAYEWLVVEALARKRQSGETEGVPGIQKARLAIARSRAAHLDAGAYLQVPKVFGFHGVYKRLARASGMVDQDLLPLGGGDALLRVWEREQGFPGFADRARGTVGGKLANQLLGEVQRALAAGRVTTNPGSHIWSKLAGAFGPDDAGRREATLLWEGLLDERQPIRRELILGLQEISTGVRMSEAEALRAVAPKASSQLRARLKAIEAYERFAQLLSSVFQAVRVRSTAQGTRPILPKELAANDLVARATAELPAATRRAADGVAAFGQGVSFEQNFDGFTEPYSTPALVEAVLEHHERIQDAKGGKRPWIERIGPGFCVRPAYRNGEESADWDQYIHPYRVEAIKSFIHDLGRER
jgi:hypothetical protein